jgi:hypothetical protein
MTIRPDLRARDVERMAREHGPGSAAAYLASRKEEIEAEEQRRREAADRDRYIEAFTKAGGTSKKEGEAAWKAHRNEQAAQAALAADQAARLGGQRRVSSKL